MGRPRPREEFRLPASTIDMLEQLARQLGLTPAGVVHLLASRELGEDFEPERHRRGAKRRPWTAARVLEVIAERKTAGLPLNHAVVQGDQSRLVTAAREHFGSWDAALEAAGEKRPPAHGVPELRGLRRIRLSRGFSQGALADRAGVSQAQISAYENGKALPSQASAKALARTLAVDLAELLRG